MNRQNYKRNILQFLLPATVPKVESSLLGLWSQYAIHFTWFKTWVLTENSLNLIILDLFWLRWNNFCFECQSNETQLSGEFIPNSPRTLRHWWIVLYLCMWKLLFAVGSLVGEEQSFKRYLTVSECRTAWRYSEDQKDCSAVDYHRRFLSELKVVQKVVGAAQVRVKSSEWSHGFIFRQICVLNSVAAVDNSDVWQQQKANRRENHFSNSNSISRRRSTSAIHKNPFRA